MNKKNLLFIIPISLMIVLPLIVYGVSISTIDNSGRREYTYCPLSDSDVKSMSAEINGCPLARVYVNDWNSKTPLEQTTIDILLRSKGFVDSSENILK